MSFEGVQEGGKLRCSAGRRKRFWHLGEEKDPGSTKTEVTAEELAELLLRLFLDRLP